MLVYLHLHAQSTRMGGAQMNLYTYVGAFTFAYTKYMNGWGTNEME